MFFFTYIYFKESPNNNIKKSSIYNTNIVEGGKRVNINLMQLGPDLSIVIGYVSFLMISSLIVSLIMAIRNKPEVLHKDIVQQYHPLSMKVVIIAIFLLVIRILLYVAT